MADNQIVLDAVARTAEAKALLEEFISNGEQALNRLAAIGEEGLPLNVAQAKLSLESLLADAKLLQEQVERGESVNLEAGRAQEVLQGVRDQISQVGTALDQVSERAQRDLQEVGDVASGVAASAATQLQESFAPLRQVAADAQPAIEALEKLRAEEEAAAQAAQRFANPFAESLAKVEQGLAAAEEKATRFETAVSQGGRGAAKQISVLALAIEDLKAEIASLAAEGADVGALQARLAGLEGRLEAGTLQAGRFRAQMQETADQLRVATIRAGEFEGQVGSLQDLLEAAGLKFVGPLFAIQAAYGLLKGLTEEFWSIAGPIFEKYEENIYTSKNRLSELIQEYKNLNSTLEKEGFAVENRRIEQLREAQQKILEQVRELQEAYAGEETAQEIRTAALLTAAKKLLDSQHLTYAATVEYIDLIQKQIDIEKVGGRDTEKLQQRKLELINQGTLALVKQGVAVRDANGLSEEGATKFISLLNQQIQTLEDLAQKTTSTERQKIALAQESIAVLQRRETVMLQEGLRSQEQADAFTAAIQRQIEVLRQLGLSTADLEKLLKSFQAIQRAAQLDSISVGLRNLREFASEAQRGGRITTEQADQIVAKYRELVQEIAKLPEAERQQYAGRLKEANAYYQKFFELSSTYRDNIRQEAEKLAAWVQSEEELFKRREATIKGFAQTLADAAKSLPDSPNDKPKQSASDLNAQIRDKQQQLADLESKTFQSPEDLGTIEKLRQDVQGLTKDLRELGGGAQGAGGDFADLGAEGQAAAAKIRQEIVSLITTNDDFRKGFRNMPQEFKDAAEQMVSGFLSDLDSGLMRSSEDVQNFVERFAGLLQQGGAVSDGVVAQLRAMGNQAQTTGLNMSHLFDGLEQSESQATQTLQSVVNQLLHQLGVSQQYTVVLDQQGNAYLRLAGNAQQAASAATATGSAVASSAPNAGAAARSYSQLADALAATERGASSTATAAAAVGHAVDQAGASSAQATAALTSAGQAADDSSRGYIRASQGVRELSEGTKEFIENARQTGHVAGEAGQQVEQMGQAAEDTGGKIMAGTVEVKNADQASRDLAASVTQSVDAYNQAVAASHEAADASQQVAASTSQAGDSAQQADGDFTIFAQGAGGLVKQYVEIKNGAHEAGEGIHKTGEEARQAAPTVEDLSKGMQGVADSSKQATQGLTEGAERLGSFASSAKEAAPATQEVAKGLGAVKEPASSVAESFERIGKSGAADELQKDGQAMKDISTNASDVKDKVKGLDDEMERSTKGLKDWRTELKGAGDDLTALVPKLSQVLKLCQDLAACQAGAAANG